MPNSFALRLLAVVLLCLPLASLYAQEGQNHNGPAELSGGTGTVKNGDYSNTWQPSWSVPNEPKMVINPTPVLIVLLAIFFTMGLYAAVRGIRLTLVKKAALLPDSSVPAGGTVFVKWKDRAFNAGRRGPGLRFKLALFTTALVLLMIFMVSIPLYYMMIRERQKTLLKGLWDRSTVLLAGLSTNARAYLSSENIPELSLLPAHSAAIPEARYVTITGYDDRVWATNDPDILSKIDTPDLQPGISVLSDIISPRLEAIGRDLNMQAIVRTGQNPQRLHNLILEAASLAQNPDQHSIERLHDVESAIDTLEASISQTLEEIARQSSSEPEYVFNYIPGNHRFIFFKPIMVRRDLSNNYFSGLVRLEVSIDSITDEIRNEQALLRQTILIISFAVLVIGIIGAFILASLIILPIRKLVRHVEIIRDTENKAKLAGMEIRIASRDEIAVLGDTINDMTLGLVKAAAAAAELSIGKEIQKKFLPLELDRSGTKLNSGHKDTENASFFGYYEEAKGISGDYFDYRDIDGRYYAIIKCDVAGKGVPASLIMIQIATMFLSSFRNWKPSAVKTQIREVVYEINGFIETMGFDGRFAAFTLCIFDSETGKLFFCNAGDNIIHLFDSSEGRIKSITLPATPAAGVLTNNAVEASGGYRVQTLTLNHGDILLLYTDGIEEAKRKFRSFDFSEIRCPGGPEGMFHGNHTAGQEGEAMGPDRVYGIVNAVMNRKHYSLYKWHNPEGEQELCFDFSGCNGRVEEVIMALIAAQKIFRCYRDPAAGEDDRVLVDKKIDDFLKIHFVQYRVYCAYAREYPDNDAYICYTHLKEDEQNDDLTILGIKRK